MTAAQYEFWVKVALTLFAGVPTVIAIVKMCWHVADFAISAKKDIANLTRSVERLEGNVEAGLKGLEHRVTILETTIMQES